MCNIQQQQRQQQRHTSPPPPPPPRSTLTDSATRDLAPMTPPTAMTTSKPPPPPPPATLQSLPPDVLHHVLLSCSCQDAARLKLVSRRLRAAVSRAGAAWAPLVEARMRATPHLRGLWRRMQAARGEGALEGAQTSTDWLRAWCCLERAARGPWALGAEVLSRRAAPHGVLLVFELSLAHSPPAPEPLAPAGAAAETPAGPPPAPRCHDHGSASAPAGPPPAPPLPPHPAAVQQHAWRDTAPFLSFRLDGRRVEVCVDAAGRVASPQRDWARGALALAPGRPLLLALEVSYLLPTPAWAVHPAARDAATGRLQLDLSAGFGSYVADPRYPSGGGLGGLGGGGGGGSTAAAAAAARAAATGGGGLTQLELCGALAWRPSRVAAFFSRLLGPKGGAREGGGSGAGTRAATAASADGGGTSSVSVPGCVGYRGGGSLPAPAPAAQQQPPPPPPPPPASATHLLRVSKAAVWQVPADCERRFEAPGFLFSAEDYKGGALLRRHGLLPPLPIV